MLNILTPKKYPFWFMRQSGRYLPEYQQIRKNYSFLQILNDYNKIVELTLLPLKYFTPNFLIIFSDISIVFSLMTSVEYDIVDSKGPVIKIQDINKIELKDTSSHIENLKKAIKTLKKQQSLPIIGFIGGIYTTLFYLLKQSNLNKTLIYNNEDILYIITQALYQVAKNQIESGADLIQIFDTYLFDLSPLEIEFFIIPFYKIILNKLKSEYPHIPIIFFSLNTIHIINYLKELKIDVLSVDWKQDLKVYFDKFEGIIQGNLDPFILTIEDQQTFSNIIDLSLKRIFKNVQQNEKRFIFNLGHGLYPNTKIQNLLYLVEKLQKIQNQ